MTIQTVMTLNTSQVAYLRAAIACLLAVQGEAGRPDHPTTLFFQPANKFCADLRDEALDLATNYGTVSPLDHQDGAELAAMLANGTLELRLQAPVAGITTYYADAPGSYTDQVGPDEEAWKVPCVLTVTGAETEDAAAVLADTFLGRAMMDPTVNSDEMVLAFDVGYEAAFIPSPVPAIAEAHQS